MLGSGGGSLRVFDALGTFLGPLPEGLLVLVLTCCFDTATPTPASPPQTLAGMSVCIVLAEATIATGGHPDLSVPSWMIHNARGSALLVSITVFLPLLYMVLCTYFSLFRLAILRKVTNVPSTSTHLTPPVRRIASHNHTGVLWPRQQTQAPTLPSPRSDLGPAAPVVP